MSRSLSSRRSNRRCASRPSMMLQPAFGCAPGWLLPMRAPCIRHLPWNMPIRRQTSVCWRRLPPDGLAFDITGCAHLFGGEATLCRDLVGRLATQGVTVRIAVADTLGSAYAVARFSEMRADSHVIVPPGDLRAPLASLPLVSLRLAPDVADALGQVGLKLIGDVLERPRAPLAARFGVELLRRLDQALGLEDEPIRPRLPVPVAMVERRFPEPIGLESDVLGTIGQLARDLDRVLERRGEGARLLQVALFRVDGKVHRIELGTSAPVRDPMRVQRLFIDRLAVLGDACDPGFGFDMLRLAALVTERFDPPQIGFWIGHGSITHTSD